MKTYKQSDIILPDELTELRGRLYRAVKRMPRTHCSAQCRCYNIGTDRCNGLCFRWKNMNDIVFIKDNEPQGDYEIIETEFAKACREAMEQKKEEDAK